MKELGLPEHVRRLDEDEEFRFSCHPGVPCFTECCRQLDLALTPYDVIRLRRALGITCSEFLDRYAVIEKGEDDVFPQVYLGMLDDGRGSCPFVGPAGCTVYPDRPGACRTYPAGRASYLDDNGRPAEFHVLLNEPHCRGFEAGPSLTLQEWIADQELAVYNALNDEVMALLHHRRVREGFRPGPDQLERYLQVLYDLDSFRIETDRADGPDDEELLRTAVRTLLDELFG